MILNLCIGSMNCVYTFVYGCSHSVAICVVQNCDKYLSGGYPWAGSCNLHLRCRIVSQKPRRVAVPSLREPWWRLQDNSFGTCGQGTTWCRGHSSRYWFCRPPPSQRLATSHLYMVGSVILKRGGLDKASISCQNLACSLPKSSVAGGGGQHVYVFRCIQTDEPFYKRGKGCTEWIIQTAKQ